MDQLLTITCLDCGNVVQYPRPDVERAGILKCACGSQRLDIREPNGHQLVHRSQLPGGQLPGAQPGMQPPQAAAPAQAPAAGPPSMTPEGLIYTVTCRSCGNQVEVPAEQFNAAGQVRCNCGSTDLDVQEPPPTTAELMMAVRALSSMCPLCRNTGWVETEGGKMYPCKACQGA